jgi:hypothetical protein
VNEFNITMNDSFSIIRFNRQLTKSIYLLGIFTPKDFSTLIGALALNMLILNSNLGMIIIITGYPLYLILFRLGRPAGYDSHLFKSYFYPRIYRPGRCTN